MARLTQNLSLLVPVALVSLVGCGPSSPASVSAPPPSLTAATKSPPPPLIMAAAGMPVKPGDSTKLIKTAVLTVPSHGNPFALMPSEERYEKEQLTEFLASNGSFPMYYNAPPEVIPMPEVEPQPYRRLAGILIGDSVTALIDMGNGQLQEIHPGQRIQGTEWMVASIDSEKAVLRRVGSRKLPQEVIVHLESAPSGVAPTTNQPAPGNQPNNQAPGSQPRGRGRLGGAGAAG